LTTAAAVLAPRIEFRPSSLFNTQERGVPERHAILGVEESLEGIALVVEAPDWKDLTVPLRTDRVRLDRVDQTPCLDGVATADLALTLALELHPAPKRVLVLGELAAGSEARLRAAGVAEIVKTDTPFASGSAPAGMRGFDVVFAPPRPRFQATPAWTLEPLHAAAICRCIAPGGVLAIFASASTTPSAVLTDLRDGWLASAVKPTVKPFVALVANGLLEPAVGLLVRDGGAPPPEDGPVELRGLTQSRSLPPFAPCRAFETVGFGDRFSETRRACAAESVEWFVETVKTYGADARAARGQLELAGALAAFHRAPWRFNSFRPPADQVPVPDGVLDSLVKAVSESPALWPRAGAAARQVGALLTAQRSFSRLLDFSRKILDVKPDAWHARRDLARAHRELLDPETALSILEGAPSATDAEGAVALAVERSRVQIALVRAPSAVQGLREALTTRPTSLPLLEALVDAYLAAGDAAQAVVTAKHHASLTGGDASSEALLRRANAAGGAASRGAAGR
jgi:tetratricopeptide (TPR) repeat protein